jgi:hypothetical protein
MELDLLDREEPEDIINIPKGYKPKKLKNPKFQKSTGKQSTGLQKSTEMKFQNKRTSYYQGSRRQKTSPPKSVKDWVEMKMIIPPSTGIYVMDCWDLIR